MSSDEYQPESPVYVPQEEVPDQSSYKPIRRRNSYRRNHHHSGDNRRNYSRVRYDNRDVINFVRRRRDVTERSILRRFPGIDRSLRRVPNLRFVVEDGQRIWSFYHFDRLCDDIIYAIQSGCDNINLIQSKVSHRYASIRSAIDILISRDVIGTYNDSEPILYFCK